MKSDEVAKWREWKRNHPDYPLTVAPSGIWCKKVRGKTRYFGSLRDPDAALKNWLEEKDYLLAGQTPPKFTSGVTVEKLLDDFLEKCDKRIEAGKMASKTKYDYLPLREVFQLSGVSRVPAASMGPDQFAAVMRVIESGRTLRTQKNLITSVRSLFKWAIGMERISSVKYGPEFTPPRQEQIEVEQEEGSACRFIEQPVIASALEASGPRMRVMILLGINCAFNPGDSIAITLDHLKLDGEIPYHEFRRVKNGRRRAAVLWPETVDAVHNYVERSRRPADPDEPTLILTQHGQPYTKKSQGKKIGDAFRRLLEKSGAHVDGVNLGSLRHTYATVIDRHPDQSMIDLTMGHVGSGMQKRVYRQLNLDELERLKAISDVARKWMFPAVN